MASPPLPISVEELLERIRTDKHTEAADYRARAVPQRIDEAQDLDILWMISRSPKINNLPSYIHFMTKKNCTADIQPAEMWNKCLSEESVNLSRPSSLNLCPNDGFTKRKRDRSECACESVGDNFETQYKPITNQKLGSSDRVSIMVMDDKFVEDLITNYRRILDGGRCFSPSSAMRCLKKSITRPYKCKKLREKLSYLHAIHAGRNDDFAGRSYQRFKDKYEDTCFWKDYLHIVEHPDFNRFLAKSNSSRSGVGNGSRSRSCNNLSAGAGPSSVNFDNDQGHSCKTVYDIVEKLNVEETTLNRALHAFQSKELRLFFMLLPNDDRRRSFLHDNFST